MADTPVIYQEALNKWGLDNQLNQMAEECAEYIAALNRYRRGRISREQLIEEIADVSIMSDQMQLYFDLSAVKQVKIDRLEVMVQGE